MIANSLEFYFGLWIGGLINFVWRRFFNKYELIHFIRSFEHYHWSYVLFNLSLMFTDTKLLGISFVLLLDEILLQKHAFAIKSDHFWSSLYIFFVFVLTLNYHLLSLLLLLPLLFMRPKVSIKRKGKFISLKVRERSRIRERLIKRTN